MLETYAALSWPWIHFLLCLVLKNGFINFEYRLQTKFENNFIIRIDTKKLYLYLPRNLGCSQCSFYNSGRIRRIRFRQLQSLSLWLALLNIKQINALQIITIIMDVNKIVNRILRQNRALQKTYS